MEVLRLKIYLHYTLRTFILYDSVDSDQQSDHVYKKINHLLKPTLPKYQT